MKKINVLLLLVIVFFVSTASAQQTFQLVRSIDTHDVVSLPFRPEVEDTKSTTTTLYTHTGTMKIENGVVTFDTLQCYDDICVRDNSAREILFISNEQDSVAIEDEDALLGAKLLRIIATTPNLILMDTFSDGTVLITEWQAVN